MILTCKLCQSQFLTESDPHVIIPGPETKVYCYCKVKGDYDQRWIEQLKHEKKLYQKHLDVIKAQNERLEAEIAELKQKPINDKDYEAFNEYVHANKSIYFGVPSWEINTDRTVWLAACEYKQKYINELELENTKLNQEIEKFEGYLEAWGKDE